MDILGRKGFILLVVEVSFLYWVVGSGSGEGVLPPPGRRPLWLVPPVRLRLPALPSPALGVAHQALPQKLDFLPAAALSDFCLPLTPS